MDSQLVIWLVARTAGLSAYAAICISIISGIALRTSVLDWLAKNRALRSLHDWTTWLWIPLGALHIGALLLDRTARITPIDVVVPFQVDYGTVGIGLGTVSLDVLVAITVTSWLRRRMNDELWRWIHRSSYVMFLVLFLHAYLSGTDFDSPIVSAISWSAAGALALLAVSRIAFGRLPD